MSPSAIQAERYFEQLFQRREVPDSVPTRRFTREVATSGDVTYRFHADGEPDVAIPADTSAAGVLHMLGLASSRAEAKRLLSQGSTEVNGQQVVDVLPIDDQSVIRVGKRRFLRLVEDRE